jgi:exosortase
VQMPVYFCENRSLPRFIWFGLLCLISAALVWRSIADTVWLALHNDAYTQIILIVPISAALIFSQWNWADFAFTAGSQSGKYLFAIGILIIALNRWWLVLTPDQHLAIDMLALVVLWISAFMMYFGIRATRSLLFPLCFLFWIVPIPSFLLTDVVHWLQQASAIATWVLFSVSGTPAVRDGVLVSIPGLTLEVAKECSSIRSSLMLLVTTMVVANVLLKTFWRKTLLTLVAVPLSIAKNGLRIFTLAMLGTRVDRSFLSGRLHHDGGIVFFFVAILMIGILLRLLQKGEREIGGRIAATPIGSHTPRFAIDGPSN